MNSPFKFLDAYTSADSNAFFGRAKEEKLLYQQLRTSSVVMVYGLSGTGKTSLVQAGLSKFYEGPDWHPFYIRRNENINESLNNALKNVLESPFPTNLNSLVSEVYSKYYRPVFLIFDQFEEIFTLNKSDETKAIEERKTFFTNIQELTKQNLPLKIIILVREEFLGQLYEYEQYIPNLFDTRLRVEPMNRTTIEKEVIGKLFSKDQFDIVADEGITKTIVDNLIKGQATSQLAFLQVYLDSLWKTAYRKVYGKKEWEGKPPSVKITDVVIKEVGDVNKVLENFLEDKKNEICKELNIQIEQIDRLLDDFTTDDGTKRPIDKKMVFEFPDTEIIKKFIAAKLIREDNRFFELSHDSLAGIILGMQDQEQKLVKRIVRNLKDEYEQYSNNNENEEWLLKHSRIAQYDSYQEKIDREIEENLIGKTKDFIEKSRLKVEKEKLALEAKNKLLTQQQADLDRKNKKLVRWGWFLFLWIFVAFGTSIYAFYTREQAKESEENEKNMRLLEIEAREEAFRNEEKAIHELTKNKIETYRKVINRALIILENGNNCPDSQMIKIIKEMDSEVRLDTNYYINHPDFVYHIKVLKNKLFQSKCEDAKTFE